jgi:hypothetical protein
MTDDPNVLCWALSDLGEQPMYFRYERLKWGAETKPHMVAISTMEQDV